jgi:hypothetical protein
MKIYDNIVQQSPEWFEIRKLKMTASHATAIGNCGSGLDTYIDELILDVIAPEESYTSKDMERGNELEPIARLEYEFKNDIITRQVGFIEYNNYVGCSPDSLVGEDGGLELKARNNKKHLALLRYGKVDSATIWQMNMCMLICNRKWWDFGSYNPNFKHSLYLQRFSPDKVKFEKLLNGFGKGEQMIKDALSSDAVNAELRNLKIA